MVDTSKIVSLAIEARSKMPDGWYIYDHRSKSKREEVAKLFKGLAQAQRGKPERVMLKLQRFNPGVFGFCAEHIGDLTHRMSELVQYGIVQEDTLLEKIKKTYRILTQGYGFQNEVDDNIRDNRKPYESKYYKREGLSDKEFRKLLRKLGDEYALEHSKLLVYNYPQYLAREAAVSLGFQHWRSSARYLKDLRNIIESRDWPDIALSYELSGGQVVKFGNIRASDFEKTTVFMEVE